MIPNIPCCRSRHCRAQNTRHYITYCVGIFVLIAFNTYVSGQPDVETADEQNVAVHDGYERHESRDHFRGGVLHVVGNRCKKTDDDEKVSVARTISSRQRSQIIIIIIYSEAVTA